MKRQTVLCGAVLCFAVACGGGDATAQRTSAQADADARQNLAAAQAAQAQIREPLQPTPNVQATVNAAVQATTQAQRPVQPAAALPTSVPSTPVAAQTSASGQRNPSTVKT